MCALETMSLLISGIYKNCSPLNATRIIQNTGCIGCTQRLNTSYLAGLKDVIFVTFQHPVALYRSDLGGAIQEQSTTLHLEGEKPPKSHIFFFYYFIEVGWDWAHLVRRPLIGLLYQHRVTDEHGACGGMRNVTVNLSTRRKPTLVTLPPPQIPYYVTWVWTRTDAVGSRRLTSWVGPRHSSSG
jgi:hypothetical protein